MLALFLIALGTSSDSLTISLLIVGVVILLLGIAGWLYFLRPWTKFDDLKAAYYTGHEEHAHGEAETAVKTEVGAAAPAAAPVKAAAAPAVVETAVPVEPVKPKPARTAKAKPAPAVAEAAAPVEPAKAKKPAKVKPAPAQPAKAAPTPDDLTLLEGIGPKSAAALAAGGVTTFAQVADLTPEALEALVKGQKVRLVGSTVSWPAQARLAAAGDLTALEDLKKRVKSGGKLHDDLTQIEGIGPKAQQALYQAGLLTYGDLSRATTEALRQILAGAGLTTLNPDRWPEQAALVVSDNLTGLKKLQDEL
jgi:predicted flap endonuclease-1-like 5' DNA nuclease